MPVQGPQQPGFLLPGTEYFSLSPNTSIALGGRRRRQVNVPSTSIPAGGSSFLVNSAQIEVGFTQTSGVYVHNAWLLFLPADGTQELQVTSSAMALVNTSGSTFGFNLGVPLLTQLTPGAGQVAIAERDVVCCQKDITGIAGTTGPNLFFTAQATFKNLDSTNPHSMQIVGMIIYTRLDGILE